LYQGQLPINEVELIANELGVSKRNAKEMNDRFNNDIESLNTNVYLDEDVELIDTIVEQGINQETMLIEAQEQNYKREKFKQAFALLNEREQDIIQERRLKEKATTLEVLSQKYKISGEAVRQIEKKAMDKLQIAVQY
ncbi:MAG TPA: sigma factor-like helix-turn-helix DNA-binding protein, partial [Candidatus Babeliales bacterium]|nr:sigma factor-like helix-turn-helix DNA-binding protein [Candidatus Babeliales bacterium]